VIQSVLCVARGVVSGINVADVCVHNTNDSRDVYRYARGLF